MDNDRARMLVKISGNGPELYRALGNLVDATALMMLNVKQLIDPTTGEEYKDIQEVRMRLNEANTLLRDLKGTDV